MAVLGVASAAGLAIWVAPAQATFHLEKVNEVMLASAGGDSSVQFVELLDTGGTEEAFPPTFAPYKLVIYDGAGKQLGEQTLNPNGLRSAASAGREYLISTAAADAAFGVQGDEKLTITLPLDTAQVCYRGNPGNISCITYVTITQPVPINSNGSGAQHGPVPPNGESDQRQPDNSIQAAPPTPKARNRAGTGTPTPGGGSPSTTAPQTTVVGGTTAFGGLQLTSRVARTDHRGRAHLSLRCPAGTSGACRGQVTLSARSGGARVGHAAFVISAGSSHVVAIRLTAAARRTLARAKRLAVRARIVASDDAGHSVTERSRLTLER
jgi:hypothetical protein